MKESNGESVVPSGYAYAVPRGRAELITALGWLLASAEEMEETFAEGVLTMTHELDDIAITLDASGKLKVYIYACFCKHVIYVCRDPLLQNVVLVVTAVCVWGRSNP